MKEDLVGKNIVIKLNNIDENELSAIATFV